MLVQLGKRPERLDVVDLLLDCHDRIRKFTTMARDLAAARGARLEAIREAAAQVRRYFIESLPLHMADEEKQILPRLIGMNAELDRALAAMEADHMAHEPLVRRLVELCSVLVADPRQIAAVATELHAVAMQLTTEFFVHLEREERVIFPALRRLPSDERTAIRTAMRARREDAAS